MATASPMASINEDLEAVEAILSERSGSDVPLAREVCSYVHAAGGKRLRPALVLLSARALGCATAEPLYAGAAAEMIHAATLLHDDVLDLAGSRRGTPTANARWGDGAAVMAGNLLLSHAFQVLVERRQTEVLQALSETMLTMCRGELLQNLHRGDLEMGEETYLDIIRSKTADFLGTCCRCGALLAGDDPGTGLTRAEAESFADSLAGFGLALGIAFQITDDLLDFVGDEAVTGKPLGGDLREGKTTLPLILALAAAAPRQRERVRQVARGASTSQADFLEVRQLVLDTGAHLQTRDQARSYLREAEACLASLPGSASKSELLALAASVSERTC